MPVFRSSPLFILLTLVVCAAPPAAHAASDYDLKAQLALLLTWWPGEYDNHEQIVRQWGGDLSALTDAPFYRVHSRHERVKDSALGPDVISVVD